MELQIVTDGDRAIILEEISLAERNEHENTSCLENEVTISNKIWLFSYLLSFLEKYDLKILDYF